MLETKNKTFIFSISVIFEKCKCCEIQKQVPGAAEWHIERCDFSDKSVIAFVFVLINYKITLWL